MGKRAKDAPFSLLSSFPIGFVVAPTSIHGGKGHLFNHKGAPSLHETHDIFFFISLFAPVIIRIRQMLKAAEYDRVEEHL